MSRQCRICDIVAPTNSAFRTHLLQARHHETELQHQVTDMMRCIWECDQPFVEAILADTITWQVTDDGIPYAVVKVDKDDDYTCFLNAEIMTNIHNDATNHVASSPFRLDHASVVHQLATGTVEAIMFCTVGGSDVETAVIRVILQAVIKNGWNAEGLNMDDILLADGFTVVSKDDGQP